MLSLATLKTPGVYIDEVPKFPPSIAAVETAIPAFIGYTAKSPNSAKNIPQKIGSMIDFELFFGGGPSPTITEIVLNLDNSFASASLTNTYFLYDSLRMFYANGGGDCYIVSIGRYTDSPAQGDFTNGITALMKYDEPTILLFPDAVNLTDDQIAAVQQAALAQCADQSRMDRVVVMDLKKDDLLGTDFRDKIGINNLKYGMAYTPWLTVSLPTNDKYADIKSVIKQNNAAVLLENLTTNLDIDNKITELNLPATIESRKRELEQELIDTFPIYKAIVRGLDSTPTIMPPSGAIAGVYAYVDNTRGVWKAPANVSLNNVIGPNELFTESELGALNIDVVAGKSINAIRSFQGKGTLVYGARTLAGNDLEWGYISVRRFFNMVEESCKKATEQFVFEPNDANTWVRVQSMIDNFLWTLWRDGALQGATPQKAYYVSVGLGKTMAALDILQGRMIVEIGLAVVRPAEFIVLRFSHKLPEA